MHAVIVEYYNVIRSLHDNCGNWLEYNKTCPLTNQESLYLSIQDQSQPTPKVEEKSDPVQPPTDMSKSKGIPLHCVPFHILLTMLYSPYS